MKVCCLAILMKPNDFFFEEKSTQSASSNTLKRKLAEYNFGSFSSTDSVGLKRSAKKRRHDLRKDHNYT